MAAILTDMADSQVPALSPIKSPKRPRDYDGPVNEIPDADPTPKKHKADEVSKSTRNRLMVPWFLIKIQIKLQYWVIHKQRSQLMLFLVSNVLLLGLLQ